MRLLVAMPLLLLIAAAGCDGATHAPTFDASGTPKVDSVLVSTGVPVLLPDDVIRPDSLLRLGAQVAGLRATPGTIRLRVGERLPLRALAVVAVDSAGRALGPVIVDTETEE